MNTFSYEEAFSRNIGWVTKQEQKTLGNSKIAIGGLGGVGGDHAVVLTRLGIGQFHIADMDYYEVGNFNRQAGACLKTIGKAKSVIMNDIISGINPLAEIVNYDEGINENNLEAFLDGVDVYVDSLDIFALDVRRKVFAYCYKNGIPAISAAPLGMGTSIITFLPNTGVTFDEYFDFVDCNSQVSMAEKEEVFIDNVIKFIIGMAPTAIQLEYLQNESSVNFQNRKAPSVSMSISLAAGVLCTNVLKIILKRGEVLVAPQSFHFDAYLNSCERVSRKKGNKETSQLKMFEIFKNKFNK